MILIKDGCLTEIITFIMCFFFNDTATTEIYTLSLHDALPISRRRRSPEWNGDDGRPLPREHAGRVAGRVRSVAGRRAGLRRGALAGHSTGGLEGAPSPRVSRAPAARPSSARYRGAKS